MLAVELEAGRLAKGSLLGATRTDGMPSRPLRLSLMGKGPDAGIVTAGEGRIKGSDRKSPSKSAVADDGAAAERLVGPALVPEDGEGKDVEISH